MVSGSDSDRGNISVAVCALLCVLALLAMGLSKVAVAADDRVRSGGAADALALAAATDTQSALWLQERFRSQGIESDFGAVGEVFVATASAGGVAARSKAELVADENRAAPMIYAVLARASQLLDFEFDPSYVRGYEVGFDIEQADLFDQVAFEFEMCRVDSEMNATITFMPCGHPLSD